jgi:Mg2+ and Co2+ transporter CorA
MIPRQEILKQINRFYDMIESIDNQIEQSKATIPDETNKDQMDDNLKLLMTYFKLTAKVGPQMMDAIDNLKTQLDILEHE